MVVAEVCSSMKYPKRCQYKHAKQKKYHVRNWAEYNEGLRRRGDLTVWFDEEVIPFSPLRVSIRRALGHLPTHQEEIFMTICGRRAAKYGVELDWTAYSSHRER